MSVKKDVNGIVDFLVSTLAKTNARGYVLGLSGGIDSAVVAGLAKLAVDRFNFEVECGQIFGREHVTLTTLIMPIKSSSADEKDAKAVAAHLQLDAPKEIYLLDTFNAFTKSLNLPEGDDSQETAKVLGNVKARLRMTALYYYANANNLLVLGTDNLTETYTGYFTKHGDGAADVFPISDFVKREVYDIGKEIGLPECVMNRKPSAGLWDGQTDEDEMGIPYDFIDNRIEDMDSLNELTYGTVAALDYGIKLQRLHAATQHKRSPPHVFHRAPDASS